MTPPDSSRADDRPEWLAGYADGELDEAARRRVEERLECDPAAADALRDQEQLSPANRELWDAVAPPEPSEAEWAVVTDRVADATLPARGIFCKPIAITKIVTSTGQRLPVESAGCKRVMSQAVADAANYILAGDLTSGTATVDVTPYEDTEACRDAADRTLVELRGDTLVAGRF